MWITRTLMLGLLVASVGCGGSDAEEAGPTTSAAGATSTTTATACGDEDAEAVTLTTEEGAELNAALVGDGEIGVVLGHQFRSDMCSWVPFAKELAERNMRALAINFAGASLDDDMVAGARELQRRGAERIMLVGASMGGTAALVATGEIDVDGVSATGVQRPRCSPCCWWPRDSSALSCGTARRELRARRPSAVPSDELARQGSGRNCRL
jgi:hypothetical protein